jgi:ABC-type Zn uptake system ZnuABC Zn-binding protein ZnuA
MNGLGLEPWIDDVFEGSHGSRPVILDTSQFVGPLTERPMSDNVPQGPDERASAQSRQSNTSYETRQASNIASGRYMWLNPSLAMAQVELIANMLIRVDPQGIALYRQNAARYTGELRNLDTRIGGQLKRWRQQTLVGADLFLSPFGRYYEVPVFAADDLIERRSLRKGQPIFVDIFSSEADARSELHDHPIVQIDPLSSRSYVALMEAMMGRLTPAMS